MILDHNVDSGVYCVRFWVDGQWVLVICDDRVPVHASTSKPDKWLPTFGECYDPSKLAQATYVSMIEKAYGVIMQPI